MGWTHYWERQVELPSDEFKKALADCKKVIGLLDISMAGADGNGQPVFTDEEIAFNGVIGANCEPFVFHRIQPPRPGRNTVFEYCKTEHLPYDLTVQCCLIILKHYCSDVMTITSDGKDCDWLNAMEVCMKILGYGRNFKLANHNH